MRPPPNAARIIEAGFLCYSRHFSSDLGRRAEIDDGIFTTGSGETLEKL